MPTTNEKLVTFQIAQQIGWIRVANSHSREIIKIMARLDEKLRKAILTADITPWTKTRAAAVLRQVKSIIHDFHKKEIGPWTESVAAEIAVMSSEVEAEAFKRAYASFPKAGSINMDIITPNPGLVATLATTRPYNGIGLDKWLVQLRDSDLLRTWATIQDGMLAGATTEDIVKAVNGTKSLGFKDGIREVSRRGAKTLVRTVINHAAAMGREALWIDNAGLVDRVKWVSTLDLRTTPICRERDGMLFEPSEGPRPPAHPNCRSTTVAVTKSWQDLGFDISELTPEQRASMNGQVPANLTYYDWLRQQSAAAQTDVLGPTRRDLWIKGGVKPDRFINDEGRLYTLPELRKKMPGAFEEAGL
jgi:SPP1 gp7 family putative phage head morphogenesis protein